MLVEKTLDIGLTVASQIPRKAEITLLIIPHVHLTLWVRMCMIKPKKLLSSLTFVIITSNIKSSLLLNYIGMFKFNLMLGLKGNRWEGRNYCYLEASDSSRFLNWSQKSSLKLGITVFRYAAGTECSGC